MFIDVGGVLLTNGWGHESRRLAAEKFALDYGELEERHHLTFDTYEEGKLTLVEYLNRLVFYEKRAFTCNQFREFMYAQSTPYMDMIELIKQLKKQYQLKIAVVNNEGRELNEYRIKKFHLNQFVDFFISSCFVHFRKPDADIFRIALDIAMVPAERGVVYRRSADVRGCCKRFRNPEYPAQELSIDIRRIICFWTCHGIRYTDHA